MIFSVRQLQEKCKEQNVLLYIAFIEGLFAILLNSSCPPSLFKVVKSFYNNTKTTVQYNSNDSESLTIKRGVKEGCVLDSIFFWIFFSMLLKHAFCSSTVGVKLHTRSDRCLFNSAHLKAKSKVKNLTVRDLLFADDAALVAYSAQDLQTPLNQFLSACLDFGITKKLKN